MTETNFIQPIYIGNTRTKIYHEKTCNCANKIEKKNLIIFHDDIPASYRSCSKCKPEHREFQTIEEVLSA